MVMHPSPGHYSGTLVNALLHHCQLPAMQLATGAAAPLSLEGAAAAAAAEAAAELETAAEPSSSWQAAGAAAGAFEAAASSSSDGSLDAADAAGAAGEPLDSTSGDGESLDADNDDDEGGGFLLVGPPGTAGGSTIRPGIVHRLDRGTTGLVVVAKTDAAHLSLAQQVGWWVVLLELRCTVYRCLSSPASGPSMLPSPSVQ